MCDTILARPVATANGNVLFGKNSDRQRNEAQGLFRFGAQIHRRAPPVACTYVSIPQAQRTHAVLLSRPYWSWGAEMGANEHGVVIGNEALFSRVAAPRDKALTGLDLVRLGLERAASAEEAVSTITKLLEKHGQGGDCGHLVPNYYHNAFMIADAREAYVLETIGREWLTERVETVRALSNVFSIDSEPHSKSPGLAPLARSLTDTFTNDYAHALADPETTHIGSARGRSARATELLLEPLGRLRSNDFKRILRDHDPTGRQDPCWDPKYGARPSLCIHAGSNKGAGQTTASMIAELGGAHSVYWVTATAAPCLSIFKPLFFDSPIPQVDTPLTGKFNQNALWWRKELLHRRVIRGDFAGFLQSISSERNALEESFRKRIADICSGGAKEDRTQVVADCWREAQETENRWLSFPVGTGPRAPEYFDGWNELNILAEMP